jgi:hypothetical protein
MLQVHSHFLWHSPLDESVGVSINLTDMDDYVGSPVVRRKGNDLAESPVPAELPPTSCAVLAWSEVSRGQACAITPEHSKMQDRRRGRKWFPPKVLPVE